ncbi:hypothetical protein GEV33_001146 [Tenebrio molitor]|uniref:Uncharacterized protein n=1 Tax=Tenebrio molitor TaxID=7067 RepID=A0A8J6LH05_TENMO|nr:hypothetical protein GEV33_001146 [Tenebrio molitor]
MRIDLKQGARKKKKKRKKKRKNKRKRKKKKKRKKEEEEEEEEGEEEEKEDGGFKPPDIFGFPALKYSPLPGIFQTSCFLTLTPAHSFQNKDGQFVNVYNVPATNSEMDIRPMCLNSNNLESKTNRETLTAVSCACCFGCISTKPEKILLPKILKSQYLCDQRPEA